MKITYCKNLEVPYWVLFYYHIFLIRRDSKREGSKNNLKISLRFSSDFKISGTSNVNKFIRKKISQFCDVFVPTKRAQLSVCNTYWKCTPYQWVLNRFLIILPVTISHLIHFLKGPFHFFPLVFIGHFVRCEIWYLFVVKVSAVNC